MQKNLDAQDAKKAELENLQRELDGMDSNSPGYSDSSNRANTLTNEIADLSTKYRALEQQYNSIGATDDGGMSEALIQSDRAEFGLFESQPGRDGKQSRRAYGYQPYRRAAE
ncbi:MAG: hypothetical protein ACLTT1_18335 [[Clostridium] scindens]